MYMFLIHSYPPPINERCTWKCNQAGFHFVHTTWAEFTARYIAQIDAMQSCFSMVERYEPGPTIAV